MTLKYQIAERYIQPREVVERLRFVVYEHGKVRIPKEVLDEAGLEPGSLVLVEYEGDRIVLRRVRMTTGAAPAAAEPI